MHYDPGWVHPALPAIVKGFEPLLLTPIAFGCLLANIPRTGFETDPGVMKLILAGIKYEVFPPLIFMGVGAMTDFGPLIANPKTLLLGAAAQAGVFVALLGAMLLGFNVREAAAIGIIGGADGPTSIYLASKMAPHLLGAIAVAAYSYMSLVPLIQPPIMKLFTSKEDRKIKMAQLRTVSHFEKVVFPIVCTIFISLLLPSVCSLIGMLMLGNLFTEAGCLGRLSDTAQNALMNIVTIMLATGTGLTMKPKLPDDANNPDYFPGARRFCRWYRCWRHLRQIHVHPGSWQDQSANRQCRCFRRSDGSSCLPGCRPESQSVQLPAHACHGPERSRCYWYGCCGWYHAGHDWRGQITLCMTHNSLSSIKGLLQVSAAVLFSMPKKALFPMGKGMKTRDFLI